MTPAAPAPAAAAPSVAPAVTAAAPAPAAPAAGTVGESGIEDLPVLALEPRVQRAQEAYERAKNEEEAAVRNSRSNLYSPRAREKAMLASKKWETARIAAQAELGVLKTRYAQAVRREDAAFAEERQAEGERRRAELQAGVEARRAETQKIEEADKAAKEQQERAGALPALTATLKGIKGLTPERRRIIEDAYVAGRVTDQGALAMAQAETGQTSGASREQRLAESLRRWNATRAERLDKKGIIDANKVADALDKQVFEYGWSDDLAGTLSDDEIRSALSSKKLGDTTRATLEELAKKRNVTLIPGAAPQEALAGEAATPDEQKIMDRANELVKSGMSKQEALAAALAGK